jgi:hypothetical protein
MYVFYFCLLFPNWLGDCLCKGALRNLLCRLGDLINIIFEKERSSHHSSIHLIHLFLILLLHELPIPS